MYLFQNLLEGTQCNCTMNGFYASMTLLGVSDFFDIPIYDIHTNRIEQFDGDVGVTFSSQNRENPKKLHAQTRSGR